MYLIWLQNDFRVTETSSEAFILRIFRKANKTGFVKAFSSNPEAFSRGFRKIEKVMKYLYVKKLYLWPRFVCQRLFNFVRNIWFSDICETANVYLFEPLRWNHFRGEFGATWMANFCHLVGWNSNPTFNAVINQGENWDPMHNESDFLPCKWLMVHVAQNLHKLAPFKRFSNAFQEVHCSFIVIESSWATEEL